MSDKTRPRGLGRGLSVLLADVATETEASRPRRPEVRLPVDALHPNPNQPRRHFAQEAMDELVASIREKGVIQPLIVRSLPDPEGRFEIVAGERRWRAAQIAQLHDVPVIVRDYSDTEVLEIAIIENIQRDDLSAIDEAAAYRQLMDRFGHTQDQLATALGKSRSHIANLMRLLTLPVEVQAMVNDGRITAGHARTLVGNDQAVALARRIAESGLSVRAAERLVKAPGQPPKRPANGVTRTKDADTLAIEKELSTALAMPVSIEHSADGEGGKLILRYRDLAQLDDLLRALSGG